MNATDGNDEAQGAAPARDEGKNKVLAHVSSTENSEAENSAELVAAEDNEAKLEAHSTMEPTDPDPIDTLWNASNDEIVPGRKDSGRVRKAELPTSDFNPNYGPLPGQSSLTFSGFSMEASGL